MKFKVGDMVRVVRVNLEEHEEGYKFYRRYVGKTSNLKMETERLIGTTAS